MSECAKYKNTTKGSEISK